MSNIQQSYYNIITTTANMAHDIHVPFKVSALPKNALPAIAYPVGLGP